VYKDDFGRVVYPLEVFVEHEVLFFSMISVVLEVESNRIINFDLSKEKKGIFTFRAGRF
jgi:hypothetical protein